MHTSPHAVIRFTLRNRHLLLSDLLLLVASCVLAYTLRFEGLGWVQDYGRAAALFLITTIPVRLFLFHRCGLYRQLWHQASVEEVRRVMLAASLGTAAVVFIGVVALPGLGLIVDRIPLSVLGMDALVTVVAIALPRLQARVSRGARLRAAPTDARRVLVVGAGAAGQMTVRELFANPKLGLTPVGFVDDDPAKHHHLLAGVPVFGSVAQLPEVVKRHNVREVVIAMPTAPGAVVRKVVEAAARADIPTRTVPGLSEILSGRVNVAALRQVEIQDLLRRAPITTDLAHVRELAADRTVLVTGAGGSIGSELCRQLAQLHPHRLVLLGHGENSIFDIQQELREQHPGLTVIPVIADVRDAARLHRVFAELKPFAVFHAAAHKHVPLMEVNLAEAVANNVIGTRNVVEAAAAADVAHLVLISTDKAVRPTSIMGATKRVAEQVVQLAASRHGRNFVSVRFGNVLGSRGSVVPTFLRQIRRGGPVTITHPDMRRYFMTIPEAVQLVLQAGALGSGGEVFVLDMGEPVKIVDLAEDLIRLSGLEVGTDIEVRFTGARPGEKLYEEMFFGAENVVPTEHPKVLRAKNAGLSLDVPKKLDRLVAAVERHESEVGLRTALLALVPDFIAPGVDSTSCRPLVHEPDFAAAQAAAPSIDRRGPALVPTARRRRAR